MSYFQISGQPTASADVRSRSFCRAGYLCDTRGTREPVTNDRKSHLTASAILCRISDQGTSVTLRKKAPIDLTMLQNSADGRLTTEQLRLAYSSLVSGAASCSSLEDGSLTWFCIQLLVDMIDGLTTKPEGSGVRSEELRRLRLTLLSTVPSISLPSPLLGRLLSTIDQLIREEPSKQERSALLAAMYDVILREVGDAEREFVMRWWFALLEKADARETTAVQGPLSARL
jgi:hypothetical protein